MCDRDERGRFAKGNTLGNRFKTNGEATEAGRKGGRKSQAERKNRVQKWIEAIDGNGAHPITKEEAASIDLYLLSLTREELTEFINATDVPIIIQARAKQLIDSQTTFDATEKILDRAFGKPKNQQDINIGGDKESPVVISFPEVLKGTEKVTEEELYG